MDWNTLALSTWLTPFLPRFLLSVIVLLIGFFVAHVVTRAVRGIVVRLFAQKPVSDSPLAEVVTPLHSLQGSGLFSSVIYALVLFLFIAIAGEILGITFFSQIVSLVLAFVPNLAAALVVIVLGFLLAGIAERVVKQQFRKHFPNHALLAGTIASSTVIVFFFLMALAELGIAREFIFILFAGVVFMISLSLALALGLGGKDIVREMLTGLVRREQTGKNSQKE